MNKIKFRARAAIGRGCWVYGYFAIINGQYTILNEEGKIPVIAGTEGQYTGEKDENNEEIYENDKVEYLGAGLEGWFPGTSKRITVRFREGVFYPFDMVRGEDVRIIKNRTIEKEKTKIRVFITKHLNFRASITEPGKPAYEVTVGGKSWGEGKGRKHQAEILKRITGMCANLLAKRDDIAREVIK